MSRRDLILGTIDDLVGDFLYYDRKGDEDLPRGAIEIAEQFTTAVTAGLE
jgi:hypothetical protein